MRLLDFILTHRIEFLTALLRHIGIVIASTTVAVALGVPLGVLAHQRPRWGAPLLAIANIIQTIPSLALFGFLIPLPWLGGIGLRTALIVLILYALLPVMRGTVDGLQSVAHGLTEAALALGMTEAQTLRHVALPLARPAILTGVRVATVVGVGTATIAAAIGAGGLGEFIFRGVNSVDSTIILAGTIPAALLALFADFALGRGERWATPWRNLQSTNQTKPTGWRWAAAASVMLVLVIGAWWIMRPNQQSIVIGSKNFTESLILGELLAQVIERDAGLTVTRKFNLGDTLICEQALRTGEIDGYVEYTGTALTSIFKQPISLDSQQVNQRVAASYAATGRTMFPPLGFNNTFVILVRRETAQRFQVKTLSEASAHTRQWRAGFGSAFLDREDGYAGLAQTYGLQFAAPPLAMSLPLTYRALADRQVDLIAGDATNGLITKLDLVALVDDRQYFPPYHAVPVMLTRTLQQHPQLSSAVGRLANLLDDEAMRRLNAQAEIEHHDPAEIVRAFLTQRATTAP
jgi:osmoprotectant transport system permease protein